MLEGNKVYLRPPEIEDVEWIYNEFKDFEFRRYLGYPSAFAEITKEGKKIINLK